MAFAKGYGLPEPVFLEQGKDKYDWIIKDFRIIQQLEQKAYVVAPQTSWKGQQGKSNFKPLISIPNDVKWQVESAILAEFQRVKERTNERTI